MLLPNTDADTATTTAERICREVAYRQVPSVGRVTVSLGLATLDGESDGEELVKRADERLYAAKASGRNRVCVESPDEAAIPPDDS